MIESVKVKFKTNDYIFTIPLSKLALTPKQLEALVKACNKAIPNL